MAENRTNDKRALHHGTKGNHGRKTHWGMTYQALNRRKYATPRLRTNQRPNIDHTWRKTHGSSSGILSNTWYSPIGKVEPSRLKLASTPTNNADETTTYHGDWKRLVNAWIQVRAGIGESRLRLAETRENIAKKSKTEGLIMRSLPGSMTVNGRRAQWIGLCPISSHAAKLRSSKKWPNPREIEKRKIGTYRAFDVGKGQTSARASRPRLKRGQASGEHLLTLGLTLIYHSWSLALRPSLSDPIVLFSRNLTSESPCHHLCSREQG